jgi:hypothetical protein
MVQSNRIHQKGCTMLKRNEFLLPCIVKVSPLVNEVWNDLKAGVKKGENLA